jgi:hypothetical protein
MKETKKTNFLGTRNRKLMSAIVGALLVVVFGGAPAFTDDFVCTKTYGPITVDNLVVPDGKTCTLNGTHIEGNIFVYTGATLSAGGVHVDGNIQAEGASAVYVNPGSFVGGSIQIKQGGRARVDRVRINGDVQLESNDRAVRATKNRVGGNMQVFQNTGGVTLLNNVIRENLQCKQNNPAPTGGGNIAGSKEDQCARL